MYDYFHENLLEYQFFLKTLIFFIFQTDAILEGQRISKRPKIFANDKKIDLKFSGDNADVSNKPKVFGKTTMFLNRAKNFRRLSKLEINFSSHVQKKLFPNTPNFFR